MCSADLYRDKLTAPPSPNSNTCGRQNWGRLRGTALLLTAVHASTQQVPRNEGLHCCSDRAAAEPQAGMPAVMAAPHDLKQPTARTTGFKDTVCSLVASHQPASFSLLAHMP
jgi:hypothetical protein